MTNRLIRLQQINSNLEPVVEFARYYDDEDDPRSPNYVGYGAAGVGAGALGYGGYKADRSIRYRMGKNPGMTYAGGARDLAGSGLAKTAGAVRGGYNASVASAKAGYTSARNSVVEAAEAGRSSGAGMMKSTKDFYGRTVAGAKSGYESARTAMNPAIARTARAGRQAVAGARAAGTTFKHEAGFKKLLTHTRPTVKKLLRSALGSARHTLSVNERLIQLGAK